MLVVTKIKAKKEQNLQVKKYYFYKFKKYIKKKEVLMFKIRKIKHSRSKKKLVEKYYLFWFKDYLKSKRF